jgi:hypothetical protein
MLAHHPLDPLAADGVALGPQLGMDARRAISFPMASMNALDIAPGAHDRRSCAGSLAVTAKRSSLTATRSAHRT